MLLNKILEYRKTERPILLGVCGYANSGKTTFCIKLKNELTQLGLNVLHYEGDWRFKLNSLARKKLILTPEKDTVKYIQKVNQTKWWNWIKIENDLDSIINTKTFEIDFGYDRKIGDFRTLNFSISKIDYVLFDCSIIGTDKLIDLFDKIIILNTDEDVRFQYTILKDKHRRNTTELASRFIFTNYFESINLIKIISKRNDILYIDKEGSFKDNFLIIQANQFPIPVLNNIIDDDNIIKKKTKITNLISQPNISNVFLLKINSNQKDIFIAEISYKDTNIYPQKLIAYFVPWQQPYSSGESFVNVTNYLSNIGIPVPKIINFNPKENIILQEYVEGKRLLDILQTNSILPLKLVKKSIDIACVYCTTNDKLFPIYNYSILMEELKRFQYHFFTNFLEINLTEKEIQELESFFHWMCTEISNQRTSLILKDFNSKNILVRDLDNLVILDYQDACIGPYLYDISSLIYDPYINFNSTQIKELTKYAFEKQTPNGMKNFKQFDTQMKIIALHRSIKGIGSFVSLAFRKGNLKNLAFINNFQNIIEKNLKINNMTANYCALIKKYMNSI